MNLNYETAVNLPETIEKERNDLLFQIEQMRKEINELNHQLAHVTSDNSMLKDTIIRLAMKTVGVVN